MNNFKKIFILIIVAMFSHNLFAQQEELKWYSLKEAIELAKKNPKKIFIDMYTDWCGWCKKMDRETFNNPAISQYLKENYYLVKFNAETKDTLEFKGKKYVNKGTGIKSANDLAIEMLGGKMSYPTIVYVDENENLLSAVPGYMTPSDIEPILVFFARDIFKTTPFNEFKDNFNKTFKDTIPFVDKVKWLSLKKAEELNKKTPKKIMVFLYHNWCIDCKMMIASTFNYEKVTEYLNSNYYPVLFDIMSKDTINFNNTTFINEGKEHPYHQFAISLLNGKMNVPQMVYINELNQLTSVVPGYFTPKTVEPVLHFFKKDAFQTQKWEDFIKTFQGEIK